MEDKSLKSVSFDEDFNISKKVMGNLQRLAVLKRLAFSIYCSMGSFNIGIIAGQHFTYTNPTIYPSDGFSRCKDSRIAPLKLNKGRFLEFGGSLVICIDSLSLLFTLYPYYSFLVYQNGSIA